MNTPLSLGCKLINLLLLLHFYSRQSCFIGSFISQTFYSHSLAKKEQFNISIDINIYIYSPQFREMNIFWRKNAEMAH